MSKPHRLEQPVELEARFAVALSQGDVVGVTCTRPGEEWKQHLTTQRSTEALSTPAPRG